MSLRLSLCTRSCLWCGCSGLTRTPVSHSRGSPLWSSRAQDGPVSEVFGSGGSPVLPRWQIRAAFFRAGWSRREPIPWILLDDGGSMIAHRKRLSPVTRRVILISGDHHVSTTAGGDDGCGVETLSRLAFLAETHPPRPCHGIGEVQPLASSLFRGAGRYTILIDQAAEIQRVLHGGTAPGRWRYRLC